MLKKEFIEKTISLIRYKEIRSEIEKELDSHIEDLKKDYAENNSNISPEKIEESVIEQMGDVNTIAHDFNKVYKPKYDWLLNIVSIILLLIGLFVSSSLVKQHLIPNIDMKSISLVLLSIFIGILININNYKITEKFSIQLFIITFGITLLSLFFSIISDFYILILVSYIISYSGLLNKTKSKLYISLITIVSLLSVIALGKISLILLCVSYVVISISQVKINKKILASILCITSVVLCLLVIFSGDIAKQRLEAYFNPELSSQDDGYIYIMKNKLLSNSKFIGKSNLNAEEYIGRLSDDNIFTYIITNFGILFGLVLTFLFCIFIFKLVTDAYKINDKYGRNVFFGCSILIIFPVVLNILNGLNLIPYMSLKLPFITMNTSSIVSNILTVSLLLSIYRRKNLTM